MIDFSIGNISTIKSNVGLSFVYGPRVCDIVGSGVADNIIGQLINRWTAAETKA